MTQLQRETTQDIFMKQLKLRVRTLSGSRLEMRATCMILTESLQLMVDFSI